MGNVVDTINILSLCSGVGMLDLGLHAACEHLGFAPRVLGYCERDAYAASVLLARMEDKSLESAPVWCGDMRDMDAKPMRNYVDLVCAGLPCPAFSVAGKQAGLADHRAWGSDDSPIPQFLRIVSECRPALVFIENVPPFVRGGFFAPVGAELSKLGYEISLPLFIAAEDVGASHRRERVFVLAYSDQFRRFSSKRSPSEPGRSITDGRSDELADASRDGGGGSYGQGRSGRGICGAGDSMGDAGRSDSGSDKPQRGQNRRTALGRDGEKLEHAIGVGREESRDSSGSTGGSGTRSTAERDSIPLFAPGPGTDWGGIPEAFWPAVEQGFRYMADGRSTFLDSERADALRCGGNGCVPAQAAVAFVYLFRDVVT